MKKISIIISLITLLIISITILLFSHNLNVLKENNIIYIDPGHGGRDGGAIARNEIYEKDINLSISFILKQILENNGFNVKMTRNGDYDLASINAKSHKTEDIHERVKRINNSNCLLYISIHANIYQSDKIHGAQTFYNPHNNDSKTLALKIQESLISLLKNTNRQAKSITGKYLIDNTKKIGCLVEVGFLSNPVELKQLQSPSYQEKIAMAIFLGIFTYLHYNDVSI